MAGIFFPFVISADQAMKDFVDLGLNKQGKKSATFENITAILNKNGVQVRPIPTEKVKFLQTFFIHGGSVHKAFVLHTNYRGAEKIKPNEPNCKGVDGRMTGRNQP